MTTEGETIKEPENSTVDHWMGQEVERDQAVADQALDEAGGDMAKAEKIFDQRSNANAPDPQPTVPANERPR